MLVLAAYRSWIDHGVSLADIEVEAEEYDMSANGGQLVKTPTLQST